MSAAAAPHAKTPPLGGTGGGWERRIARHHVPLALASAAIVVLWISLPLLWSTGHQGASRAAGLAQAAGHQMPAGAGGHGVTAQSARGSGHAAPAPAAAPQPMDQMDHSAAPADPQSGEHSMPGDAAQNRQLMARLTTATGYVALGLLAATLLIGPVNLLLGRRNPISSYLRRDVGTWTAIVSVVHVVLGFQVHGPPVALGPRLLRYFFAPDGSVLTDSFGLGNWTGLAATVIVVGLLALSSDLALRTLKAKRWKWLQRLNYALFVLVVLHAIYYGALLRVTSLSTFLLGLSVVAVFAGQAVGIRLWQRRYARAFTPAS